ncbi:MAG TPA: fused MFS/spermidine synthase [Candidatus Hydrogenedentes bacterium]|nr:fused MFS/spermidine synthase [Candidatus Hydrogenedentota bacterium]
MVNAVATAENEQSKASGLTVFVVTLAFFFVSGACGLLYQVVWTRKLVLLFGTTAYAVSTVLSVFFLGLGLGSLWGGRLADRCRNPLFLYGTFEVAIGLWALVFILCVGWGEAGVVAVLRLTAGTRAMSIALRAALAAAFLILPVVLMGATLPLVAKFVTVDARARGLRVGALYSINTFGAVVGCAAAGFFLLPALGYTRATLVGVAANGAVGGLAIVLSRRSAAAAHPESRSDERLAEAEPRAATAPRVAALVLLTFAVSGFCALALEVLWTRLLVTVFLGTTYAFTTMLTTLLCGIALGSAFASSWVDRARAFVFLFGLIEALVGISCLLMLSVFAWLPDAFDAWRSSVGADWARLIWAKFWLSFAVLFVPTFLFGMTFPVVVRARTLARGRLGRDIGKLYSANTFGGVLGAIAGGYVLIPLLGTHRSIVLLAFVLCGFGALLVLASPKLPIYGRKGLAMCVIAVALFYAVPTMPDDVGLAMDKSYLPKGEQVLAHVEGVEGTVAASGPTGATGGSNRTLWINGVQATISIEAGVLMNRFQGVLPMCFDRDPRKALFMCFGSGITAGTLGLFDFERIDAVELSPDVLDVAPLFAADNFDVLNNPKINFIVDDGRNFLLTTRNRYDLITFEPMPLALAGVSTFYTREYYRLCLERLTEGGLVSQWVPLHSLAPDVCRSLVYTFASVFPEYCVWFVNADMFLVGSNRPLAIDYEGIERRISAPEIRAALADVGFHDVPELLTRFFMAKANVDRYAATGTIMTDDRPWAEFVAPKLVYERYVAKALLELLEFYESPAVLVAAMTSQEREASIREALDRRYRAHRYGLEGMIELRSRGPIGSPEDDFRKALAVDPNCRYARDELRDLAKLRVDQWLDWGEPEEAIGYLPDIIDLMPEEPLLYLLLGDAYYAAGELDKAADNYTRYIEQGGTETRVAERIQGITSSRTPP